MSAELEAAQELAELQRAYAVHNREHGFNYAEYVNPPPGSFVEHYKRRCAELTKQLGARPLNDGE
jgi:hypothetical protein